MAGVLSMAAQTRLHSNEKRFYAGIQTGPMVSIFENYFSYPDNGRTADLITFQAALVGGYDFNDIFGLRVTAGYGKNAGACNTKETSAHGFYPYTFSSINVFADAMLDLLGMADKLSFFRVKLYGGVGVGHTFNVTDPGHPWQGVKSPSTALGFRLGAMTEFNILDNLALYADVTGEGYADEYNGLMPLNTDQTQSFEGYGGFPVDLRGLISVGIIYRFK